MEYRREEIEEIGPPQGFRVRGDSGGRAGRDRRFNFGQNQRGALSLDMGSSILVHLEHDGRKFHQANLKVAEGLADALGATLACSRPIADLGWLPVERQVGLSGKTVRPKVYIACGISGESQHVAGMRDSRLIIAINSDPKAPIFRVAHYGIVQDLLTFLPVLTAAARGEKS